MENQLLSIITFLPLVAALILALFMRGDDAAARNGAKWLALFVLSQLAVMILGIVLNLQSKKTAEAP